MESCAALLYRQHVSESDVVPANHKIHGRNTANVENDYPVASCEPYTTNMV
jgi:hypothetical protein